MYGTPVPQPRPRLSTRGGFARAYTPSDHPVVAYRAGIASAAARAMPKRELNGRLASGVRIEVWCVFQRPPSHYKAAGKLREKAPQWPRPDIDNLLKGVMDALKTAAAYEDDVVVVKGLVRKRYVSARVRAHTVVRLR